MDGSPEVQNVKVKKTYKKTPLADQVLKVTVKGIPAKIVALLAQPGNELFDKRAVTKKVQAVANAAAQTAAEAALANPQALLG